MKTAFLNDKLDEETPKQWHQKFDEVVLSNSYLLNQAEKYVYSKFYESGKGVIICLYVDGMLIVDTDHVQVDLTKEFLSLRFYMKDKKEANVILVITLMDTSEKLMPNNGQGAFKKQTCITGSIIESNVLALAAVGKEAEWLRNLILEILLWSKPIAPISIRCDSAATLAKAYSQTYNVKSRHLRVRHSMIRELIMNGMISIEFVRSQQNLANHLTKGLARDLVINSAEGMGLIGLKHMYLHIILRMCLLPGEKEDEVFTSQCMDSFKGLTTKIPSSWHRSLASNLNFYDHVSFHLKCEIDRVTGGKLCNKSADESWELIENLALYDHEGWTDKKEFVKPVKAISTPQAHTKRIENFENLIFKQREEINNRMSKMFGLLKELMTSRTPEKVLIREEAKFLVTKNVNSISLARGEEERSDKKDETLDKTVKSTVTTSKIPVKQAERNNETTNKPIKKAENKEVEESKISFYGMPDSPCMTKKGVKNDIEPIVPTMTVIRLVLEWEEKDKASLGKGDGVQPIKE
nr:zinc finger, CCHC-type [Tanacetum cinerariifolium]